MTVSRRRFLAVLVLCGAGLCAASLAGAGEPAGGLTPGAIMEEATSRKELGSTVRLVFFITVLSLAPAILIMTTCFTRIVVVLALLRQAISARDLPPNQVIVGLSLLLTFLVMAPVWQRVNEAAVAPYMAGEITDVDEAFRKGLVPVRGFLFDNVDAAELDFFIELGHVEPADGEAMRRRDVPTLVLMPAFVLSELKKAFLIGFIIFVPFVVIDMVVASVLVSMGMLMVPPVFISMPFKLLLFVLVDGWRLVVGSLIRGYG
jgi:flagellar biosynthetic protein FliP